MNSHKMELADAVATALERYVFESARLTDDQMSGVQHVALRGLTEQQFLYAFRGTYARLKKPGYMSDEGRFLYFISICWRLVQGQGANQRRRATQRTTRRQGSLATA